MTETTPAPQPTPYTTAAPAEQKTNVLAIVSLVSAFFVSLVAIITGHIALKQIAQTGENGKGLAVAGLIIGYVGLVVGLLFIILWFAVFATFATAGVTVSTF
jgi:uncharacterized protein YacL